MAVESQINYNKIKSNKSLVNVKIVWQNLVLWILLWQRMWFLFCCVFILHTFSIVQFRPNRKKKLLQTWINKQTEIIVTRGGDIQRLNMSGQTRLVKELQNWKPNYLFFPQVEFFANGRIVHWPKYACPNELIMTMGRGVTSFSAHHIPLSRQKAWTCY